MRRIFDLLSRGDHAGAMAEVAHLEDRRLLGHVLAEHYLAANAASSGVHPTPAELQSWLAHYADQPDAPRIHALLASRLPANAALPPLPSAETLDRDEVVPEERASARPVTRNAVLDRAVRDRVAADNVNAALTLVARTPGVGAAYAALLKADIAEALFRRGRDADALRIAAEAARHPAAQAPAAFTAGLSAFALDHFEAAKNYFEVTARSEGAPAVLRSAAAFWTARAAVRARQPRDYVPWMLAAAQEPRTFYGLLARRALGLPANFDWGQEVPGEAEGAALAETASGWRALALLQIGQTGRAEAELRRLWPSAAGNSGLSRAMLVVANQAGLTGLAAQLAGLVQSADGRPRDFARFPVPNLRPQQGFRVDPALVYALARTESNFDHTAVSPAGARGIMQLLPATASYLANDPSLAGNAQRLHDPAYGLELGQRFILWLARQEAMRGDLIRVLAAYNAGPGAVMRWQPTNRHRDDPFLYLESIPINETRTYVQRVLTYSWIYASRLGLPAPSLDQLAAGAFPRIAGAEEVEAMLRQRPAGRR
ncbi:lytic transglycosylase domain-containing protein [Roseomonas sp. NAR14]|uniref:Lytic transglycosylase domain-containing protein n=1 Tax=Roseomonas acroporae TaxID=2937791 RepID=A0A9X1Y5L7_9PROT|nr:lytic transglycosylase domain-containing protein [Roseomonas acroporae]MCK8784654.1 lytic transglycosylase domain-containing protein [Roseomonas acroporae]